MAGASIVFTQGSLVGTAGMSLIGVAGASVSVTNRDNANIVNWTFTVNAVPPTSTVPTGVAQTGSSPSWSFTPDVADCYSITLQTQDNAGNFYSDTRVFGVLRTSGRLVPPFGGDASSLNFSNAPWSGANHGWDPILRAWLEYVDGGGGGGSSHFGGDLSSIDTTHQEVVGLATIPIDTTTTVSPGNLTVLVYDSTSGKFKLRRLIPSDVAATFAPTLSIANGAAQTIEIGNTVSPTFQTSPAPNASGITAATVTDSLGHSNAITANPFGPPTATGSTYSSTTNGASFTVYATLTNPPYSATNTNSATFTFASPIGFISSSAPAATQTFINTAMANAKVLRTGRGGSYAYSITSGQYACIVLPTSFGAPTFKDQNNLSYTPTLVGTFNWVSGASTPQTIPMSVYTIGAAGGPVTATPTYTMF